MAAFFVFVVAFAKTVPVPEAVAPPVIMTFDDRR
jgi:hypothetical protein